MRKSKQTTTRYAIYLRCSTDDQKQGDFTTIDTQRELNSRYVADHGGTLVQEYADDGRSGTNLNRPGWKQLLADSEQGKYDAVVCTYMSRLARGEAYHVAEFLLHDNGVCVELVQEQFTPDLAGHVNKQMTILMDGMYPKMVSQWTKTKMQQMVEQGYFCGGTIPFGYRTEPVIIHGSRSDKEPPKRLVIDENEAEVVRFAYKLFLGKRTISAVREYLKQTTSRQWTSFTAKYLLTNVVYIGVQEFGQWRNDNAHEAILDGETWQKVQELIQASKRTNTRAARSNTYTYYLRGLVKCPHCGCSYTNSFAKGGDVFYYECHHGKKKITNCPVSRINADALHKTVLDEVKRAVEHRTVMHDIIARSGGWQKAGESLRLLRGQLGKRRQFIDVQIGNLTNLLADGRGQRSLLDKLDELEAKKAEMDRETQALDAEITRSTVQRPTAEMVQRNWSRLFTLWDGISEDARAELIRGVVKEVIVSEKNSVTLRLCPGAGNSEFRVRNNSENGSGGWI